MGIHVFPPLLLTPPRDGFSRADLVFDGVEQAGPSYEVRVFLNNQHVDERSPRTDAEGYAGAFHVFGYGQRIESGGRALLPIQKRLVATEPIRRGLTASNQLTVSIVSVPAHAPVVADAVTVAFDHA
jgi:hypothetical protein